jgi:protoheme ferro-lyase
MQATSYIWIVLLGGALVAGAAFVGVLVLRPRSELILSVAGIGSFALSAYALVAVASIYARADAVLYAFAFMIAGVVGGWSLASTSLGRLAAPLVEIERPQALPPDTGKAAVIVLACVEPPFYDPRITAGMLNALADEELIEPSIGTLPFLFFAQKTRYRAVGGSSPAYGELVSFSESLQSELEGMPVATVDVATCSGEGRLAARVMEAVKAGHRKVIVAELTVADSLHIAAAKQEADALRLPDFGVAVSYTDALGSSEPIIEMLASRIVATCDELPTSGVVLVGHGQPEERAHRNPSYDEEETAFLSRLRMKLIDGGLPESNVRIAWAEWRTPDVTSAVRHLAALGCRRVVVMPGVFTLDTIGTRLDLELAVRQARVDESVLIVTLPAWRDDEVVRRELAERIGAHLDV